MSRKIILRMEADGRHATISRSQLTAPLRLSHEAISGCLWSWLPARGKHTPRSKLSIAFGKVALRSASCCSRTALIDQTNPNELYPVIATTSKLMTTGIDAQICKLIVLDSNIGSMTEFKQIIGRGTRINEDFGKHYFTIMDFRNVTALFADPEFDGDPVRVKETSENEDLFQSRGRIWRRTCD